MQQFLEKLNQICTISTTTYYKNLTTIKIGGRAEFFAEPLTISQLIKIVKVCNTHGQNFRILGSGSNILANDTLVKGVTISTKRLNKFYIGNNGFAYAQCGTNLALFITKLANAGLTGLEWAIGIPATIGGAVTMNAGAFKEEICNFIKFVDVFDGNSIKRLKKDQLFCEYRSTIFTKSKKYVIIGVGFFLNYDNPTNCREKINNQIALRLKTQNIGYANAGSIFKSNTPLAPAFMIEQSGLKGLQVGGAEVSTIHSGFIINKHNATYADCLQLIEKIKSIIKMNYNTDLELEVILF